MALIVLYLALWVVVEVAWTIPPPSPEEWIALQKGRTIDSSEDVNTFRFESDFHPVYAGYRCCGLIKFCQIRDPLMSKFFCEQNSLKHAVNNKSTLHRRGAILKYKYVQSNGVISSTYTSHPAIEVAATLYVSDYAHQVAATTVARVTKHMPPSIFQTLTTHANVGVFTKGETLTIYPEYAGLATPPGCESSCSGHCASSCTFDGRKYSSLAGTGGMRTVVVDDNVLCNSNDPYNHQSNILVHEFSHTIHTYGLSSTLKSRITSAYAHAKAYSTWQDRAYSMANELEYFAEASQSFFAAEKLSYSTGGMNTCGLALCRTEAEERQHIRERDPELYAILSEVYTNNRPSLPGNLGVCTNIQA